MNRYRWLAIVKVADLPAPAPLSRLTVHDLITIPAGAVFDIAVHDYGQELWITVDSPNAEPPPSTVHEAVRWVPADTWVTHR